MREMDRWAAGLSTEELREAVRAVLRDVLPEALTTPATGPAAPMRAETVALRTQADLDALVRRVAGLCEDPARRAALREGRSGFRLAGPAPAGVGAGVGAGASALAGAGRGGSDRGSDRGGVTRVERGAVTERAVKAAATDGHRMVLGPHAVLTPLARDRARVLGVQIEKEH